MASHHGQAQASLAAADAAQTRDDQEAQAARKGLVAALLELWPSLPCLSFGLWLAWVALSFSGATWVSLEAETGPDNLAAFYVLVNVGQACGLVLGALLASRTRLAGFVAANRTVVCAGVLAGALCLTIILIGPYYLGPALHFRLGGTGPYADQSLFWACSVITGMAMAVVLLRCGAIFGRLTPRRTIVNAGTSQLLAASVYFCVCACAGWRPVPGGPSLAGILAFSLLPVAASLLACLGEWPGSHDDEGQAPARSPQRDARLLPSQYWRLVTLGFLMSLGISLLRSTVVARHALAVTIEGGVILMLLCVLLAFALLIVGAYVQSESMRFGRALSLVGLFAASITAVASVIGGLSGFWSVLVYFAASVFDLVLWCLLAFVVRQKRISVLIVFGWGRGAFALGGAIGWAVGTWAAPLISGNISALYIIVAFAMLVAPTALFSEESYERLFSPVGELEPSLTDLFDVEERERKARAEAEASGRREGRFQHVVERRAREAGLSARETEVFRLLAMGHGTDRIADELQLAVNTVRVHTHNIYVKLGVHSRSELMALVDRDVALAQSARG